MEGGQETYAFEQAERHAYLGSDVADVEGPPMAALVAGMQVTVPLLSLPGLVLFPGDTLPLRLNFRTREVVSRALVAPAPNTRLIAVVWAYEGEAMRSTMRLHADCARAVGCVAEVRQAGRGSIVAKARQRAWINLSDEALRRRNEWGETGCVRAILLPEVVTSPVPTAAWQGSTWWPAATWRLWDPRALAASACQLVARAAPRVRPPGGDPLELSFWLARSLPWDERTRQGLLEEPSVPHRLRHELSLLPSLGPICCSTCSGKGMCCCVLPHRCSCWRAYQQASRAGPSPPPAAEVATTQALVQLVSEGPSRSFVNPQSWVFHVVTLDRADCELEGEATEADSWFPGYAWTCAYCRGCGKHLGWHFKRNEALSSGVREFYAIRSSGASVSLRPALSPAAAAASEPSSALALAAAAADEDGAVSEEGLWSAEDEGD